MYVSMNLLDMRGLGIERVVILLIVTTLVCSIGGFDEVFNVLNVIAFENSNNLLDDVDFRSEVIDVFVELLDFRSTEVVVSCKGFIEGIELVIPISKVVSKGVDVVAQGNDLTLEVQNVVGGSGDLVVQVCN